MIPIQSKLTFFPSAKHRHGYMLEVSIPGIDGVLTYRQQQVFGHGSQASSDQLSGQNETIQALAEHVSNCLHLETNLNGWFIKSLCETNFVRGQPSNYAVRKFCEYIAENQGDASGFAETFEKRVMSSEIKSGRSLHDLQEYATSVSKDPLISIEQFLAQARVGDRVTIPSGLGGSFNAEIAAPAGPDHVACKVVGHDDFDGVLMQAKPNDIQPVVVSRHAQAEYVLARNDQGILHLASRQHKGANMELRLAVPGLQNYSDPLAAAKGLATIIEAAHAAECSQLARRPIIKSESGKAHFDNLLNRIEEGQKVDPLALEDAFFDAYKLHPQGGFYRPDIDVWVSSHYTLNDAPVADDAAAQQKMASAIRSYCPQFNQVGEPFTPECSDNQMIDSAVQIIESALRERGFYDPVYAWQKDADTCLVMGGDTLVEINDEGWTFKSMRPFISPNQELASLIIEQGEMKAEPAALSGLAAQPQATSRQGPEV